MLLCFKHRGGPVEVEQGVFHTQGSVFDCVHMLFGCWPRWQGLVASMGQECFKHTGGACVGGCSCASSTRVVLSFGEVDVLGFDCELFVA